MSRGGWAGVRLAVAGGRGQSVGVGADDLAPARVPRAFQVSRATPSLMNLTEPSISRRFAPPGWNELGPMNESTLPKPALVAQAGLFGGMTW